jgi:hypothetical protein
VDGAGEEDAAGEVAETFPLTFPSKFSCTTTFPDTFKSTAFPPCDSSLTFKLVFPKYTEIVNANNNIINNNNDCCIL